MLSDPDRGDGPVEGVEVRTHLHAVPVCEPCRDGDHHECVETDVESSEVCGCTDAFHYEETLGEADAEW